MDTLLQADALDGVDVLSGVSLEELEELLQADGGLGAPAQWAISPTTAAVTAPALRCLDTDHPAGCARRARAALRTAHRGADPVGRGARGAQ